MSDPAAPDDDIIGKAYDARLMRRLLGYLRPHWRSVLVGLVVIVCTSLLQLVQPWLTKVAIDEYIVRLGRPFDDALIKKHPELKDWTLRLVAPDYVMFAKGKVLAGSLLADSPESL